MVGRLRNITFMKLVGKDSVKCKAMLNFFKR